MAPNFIQVRVKREAAPFFLAVDDESSDKNTITGSVVDQHGKELKPSEAIPREKIVAVTRAILSERMDGSLVLIPTHPLE